MLFYFFEIDLQVYQVQKMLPEIAHSTLVHYFDMLRKVILNSSDNLKMGGQVDGFQNVIEIIQSLFGTKQKHIHWRTTKKWCVFGLVERGTRKKRSSNVSDRTKQTLLPILESKLQTGSTIFHDDWAAYRTIHEWLCWWNSRSSLWICVCWRCIHEHNRRYFL